MPDLGGDFCEGEGKLAKEELLTKLKKQTIGADHGGKSMKALSVPVKRSEKRNKPQNDFNPFSCRYRGGSKSWTNSMSSMAGLDMVLQQELQTVWENFLKFKAKKEVLQQRIISVAKQATSVEEGLQEFQAALKVVFSISGIRDGHKLSKLCST
eukprot:1459375-Amphidinium_carterae.1